MNQHYPPFTQRHLSELRQADLMDEDGDEEGLFDRDSQQNSNLDEDTVLLETAGFLPLKNIHL